MKLTWDELAYIKRAIVEEERDLAEICRQEYPNTNIVIVRGHDRFDNRRYNYRACFSEDQALIEKLIADVFPNGDGDENDTNGLADRFYFIQTTFIELDQGLTIDPETQEYLDDTDKKLVYSYLKNSVLEMNIMIL